MPRRAPSPVAPLFADDKDRGLLKEVMKKSGGRLQSRAVPAGVVAEWRGKVESLAQDIRDVVQMERTERSLRKVRARMRRQGRGAGGLRAAEARRMRWRGSPADRSLRSGQQEMEADKA